MANDAEPERWNTQQVADHLGIKRKTVSAYLARGQMPPADGYTGRTAHWPWWWPATITGWQRPGMGIGGGPKPKQIRATTARKPPDNPGSRFGVGNGRNPRGEVCP